ncbi:hypothetical protein Y710_16480 [Gordonia sp. QH-12]|uniref:hypothetical protein n=1 Tax=Gordonia sp. QH-12 TaxID=1437876 RepID=UPI0007813FCE|nr:hypothetical protein [Gordonia sp. QH-12]KXT55940.1 hypothetical protein Y710_16480 [Gordonia sp. QH-12]
MSAVVGLDPSLVSAGIAILGADGSARTWSVGHTGTDGASWADRSDRIVAQTRLVLRQIPVDAALVVIEDMPSHMRPQPGLGDRWALWWGLYSAIRARQTPIAVVNPKTRAKWATGNGNSDKRAVLAAVRADWSQVRIPNDDCADALTMAAMGALHLGRELPFEVRRRHHAGIENITWPEEATPR